MKKIRVALAAVLILLIAGLVIPVDSYTTTKGCADDHLPTHRLHLVRGQSLNLIRESDVAGPPMSECASNARYTLYLL